MRKITATALTIILATFWGICQTEISNQNVTINIINRNVPATDTCECASANGECDIVYYNGKAFRNHKFEFKGFVFSDFVGIQDDQPNGLIQTNVYFSYTRPLRIRPKIDTVKLNKKLKILANDLTNKTERKVHRIENKIAKVDSARQPRTQFYLFRNIVLTDLTFSKIGNQNQELPVRYSLNASGQPEKGYFNRFDLVQYANIIALAKLNIFTIEWPDFATLYFDVIPVFYNTSISDSLRINENVTKKNSSVYSIAFGSNVKILTEQDKRTHLSAEVSYSFFIPQLYSSNYFDKANTQIKEHSGIISPNMILPTKHNGIEILDVRIQHSPPKSKVSTFLRISFFHNVFVKQFAKQNTPRNMFVQFQLGASINLEKIIKNLTTN